MINILKDYGWHSSTDTQSCNYVAPMVQRILERLSVRRVCDLGSGNGLLAGSLCASGYYVAGVEYDLAGVEIARNNFPSINFYNLGFHEDAEHVLSVEGERFDAVVSTEVIEHLFSPHQLLSFSRSILQQRGYLVISTPYHGYLKNLALSIFNKWDAHHTPLWHGGHIKFWSRNTLTELVEANGFRVTEFHGVGRMPFLWKSMIIVAQVV